MELCRYIVLNPVRVKRNGEIGAWKWSSYRSTAGLTSVPEFLSTDWLLGQLAKSRPTAQTRYREFVKEGLASRPWRELRGQIYLGSEEFVEEHSAKNLA